MSQGLRFGKMPDIHKFVHEFQGPSKCRNDVEFTLNLEISTCFFWNSCTPKSRSPKRKHVKIYGETVGVSILGHLFFETRPHLLELFRAPQGWMVPAKIASEMKVGKGGCSFFADVGGSCGVSFTCLGKIFGILNNNLAHLSLIPLAPLSLVGFYM